MFRNRGRWDAWLYHGWHVSLAYVIGFFVLLFVMGWIPIRRTQAGAKPINIARRRPPDRRGNSTVLESG